MKKYALMFPGQGAQKSGMGKDLYENSIAAKRVFDTADRVLGYNISDLCFNGTEQDLMKTINSQPCILTVSLAAYEALKEKFNINPAFTMGHSLGEYAALYAAGAVDLETVLKLIQKRAFLMNETAENSNGAMAAVLGLDNETVINITNQIENVFVANFNSPGQVVITGDKSSIDNSLDKFKAAGAKRVIPLAVSGAFHSPLMKNAGVQFMDFVADFEFNNTEIPVFSNVDAQASVSAADFKEKLPKQIYSSVLWTQTIENAYKNGVSSFIEIGPGKILAGLNKKINSELETLNIFDYESLLAVIDILNSKEECLR
ncbi:MAG: ACP S-malonyltransferase [Candidatus Gastranaerophilales bacterium]|nr:ACP S-malonyltransferase [Candidatus Gastranaerophilales bacterium]